MDFPVIMYGCESLTIKKAEHWRIDAFELWCWRRLLQSNQWILKEVNPEYSLEGLILKLQYFGHLMGRANSLENKPWCWERWKAGGKGETEDEMFEWYHWLNGHEFEQPPGDGEGQGSLVCCSLWDYKELDMTKPLNTTNEPTEIWIFSQSLL